MFYVYILESELTQEHYKGHCEDLFDRFARHNNGREKSTKHGVPWKLLWFTKLPSRSEAVILEKKIKNLSRERTYKFISKFPSNNFLSNQLPNKEK